jgi:hypothetical protein
MTAAGPLPDLFTASTPSPVSPGGGRPLARPLREVHPRGGGGGAVNHYIVKPFNIGGAAKEEPKSD